VFVGSFLQARKHVEIGDSVNGIQNDNNNIGLLIHTHNGAGMKVRTNDPGLNAISVQNSGSQAPNNFSGLHAFYVKGNGETGIQTQPWNVALSIRSFTGSTNTPQVFMVKGDGSSLWASTTGSMQMLTVKDPSGADVFRVMGDGKVSIGTVQPQCALDVNPAQNVNGLCV